MVVCELVPCGHGQVEVVLVATLAGILNSDNNNIALPANTVIGSWASVSQNDFAPTEWPRRTLAHPEGTDSDSERAVRAIYSAGSQSAIRIWVDSGFAIMATKRTVLVI